MRQVTDEIFIDRIMKQRIRVKFPRDVVDILRDTYAKDAQENFLVMLLDNQYSPFRVVLATRGLVNRTMVHPREVFREAIRANAAAVIVAHNHPSDSTRPSDEDNDVTETLVRAGKVVGIEVLDHVIFTEHSYYSYLESKNPVFLRRSDDKK